MQRSLMQAQRGATLMEILVTLFVLAIGLLGVAGMQSAGLRQSAITGMDTQVQVLVQDLAETILANDVAGEGHYAFAEVPQTMGADCMAAPCNRAQLAQYNVWRWAQMVGNSLPDYELSISHSPADSAYTIVLTWDSAREGEDYEAADCALDDSLNPGCFAMSVGHQGA